MWNERYAAEEYVYGKEPNDFLREHFSALPSGKILSLAEGEGRNAVFLARHGYEVTAVDSSEVGLAKARRLAADSGVSIQTIHADLADFDFGRNRWDGVISIFCHLPLPLRLSVHEKVIEGLKTGGAFLLEAYTPEQLRKDTGGPKSEDMLIGVDSLRSSFGQCRLEILQELEREVVEGTHHTGFASVVQMIARKR